MQKTQQKAALICIDFINEMVAEGGKLSGKGYFAFVERNQTLKNVTLLQEKFRSASLPVFHVKISFSENYIEHPSNSPLFGKAKEFKALQAETWGTEFAEVIKPSENEKTIIKRRVSAFYGTDLETTLRSKGINTIFLSGVATDLAIESAARDAHDRDFNVVIVSDCCAAATDDDHSKSLNTLQKISSVKQLSEIDFS